jgi:hypothetical protein
VKSHLKDRVLWYDGTSEVNPELVPSLLLSGVSPEKIVVTSLNEDIQQFNSLADVPIQVGKDEAVLGEIRWLIPPSALALDWEKIAFEKLELFLNTIPVNIHEKYANRFALEVKEIKKRNMEPLIRTLIHVIAVLIKNNIVWGVGRGSACASLILFLINVHRVDPVKFNIPAEEFYHD